MIREYVISGMHCAACSAAVERVVSRLAGVEAASVNLATERLRVRSAEPMDDAVMLSVKKAGYSAAPSVSGRTQHDEILARHERERKRDLRRLIVAAAFALPLFYISMGSMAGLPSPVTEETPLAFALIQLALLVPVLIAGRGFFTRGFSALFRLAPNMDSLIAVGTLASVGYSAASLIGIINGVPHSVHGLYFESAGVIITLVMLGKYFEERAKAKTSDAVEGLYRLAPETATLVKDGAEREIATDELVTGDTVRIRPGSRIPADGVIIGGSTSVDESMLTGESLPVARGEGERVTGGSMNCDGSVLVRVAEVGEDSVLARLVALVEEAQSGKAPITRLADKISGIFVPVVTAIALLSAVLWLIGGESLEFALRVFVSVMVIACPCALGLATPTAIMVGTGRGARMGILIKNGETLETACRLSTVAFDKTGTVTKGVPRVTAVLPKSLGEAEFIALFASAEAGSEHPLARAVLTLAKERAISVPSASEFSAVPGRGVSAVVEGRSVIAGNEAFLRERIGEAFEAPRANGGETALFMAADGRYAGCITVADEIKPEAAEAVSRLKRLGLDVALITGDSRSAAEAVAERVGIEKVYAGVLPDGKTAVIADLMKHGKTAMVGDGVNDAAALALADIGIALGTGTDVTISSADIVLTRSDLNGVADAVALSRRTVKTIRQNLFWAFAYNCIGIPIAAGVLHLFGGPLLNPMIAALAMSFSSVTVLTNALRLKSNSL